MLTAEVFAFTTSVEMQVAASTPPARVLDLRDVAHPDFPPVTGPESGATRPR